MKAKLGTLGLAVLAMALTFTGCNSSSNGRGADGGVVTRAADGGGMAVRAADGAAVATTMADGGSLAVRPAADGGIAATAADGGSLAVRPAADGGIAATAADGGVATRGADGGAKPAKLATTLGAADGGVLPGI